MKKTICLVIALLLICIALVGCGKTEKNKNYVIELEGNPTTGYTWTYEIADDGIVTVEDKYITNQNDEGLAGAGGKNQFTVTGVKEGTTTIKFTYARSWETTEEDKTESYKITVDKNLNVTGEKI